MQLIPYLFMVPCGAGRGSARDGGVGATYEIPVQAYPIIKVCVCVRARACVRACVCVRACACLRACVCVSLASPPPH